MPSQPPLPPLLAPYLLLHHCHQSLTLLTSTLSATTNWLVLRFLHTAVALKKSPCPAAHEEGEAEVEGEVVVVLVSWLRDRAWWVEGARKLGVDLQKLVVVDGLSSGLGLGLGLGREPAGLAVVEEKILEAVAGAKSAGERRRVVLVLDGLDFLLAATGCPVLGVMDMVGELRERVHYTVLTAAADLPLVQSPTTPLEVSHAAFVMGMAHQAGMVMSVRGLDTGVAKDVSGVLRITRGPGGWEGVEQEEVEERECLYYVGADGGVRVFERGA